jgi:drug/metabolite transporter (DMT)-like permease
MLLGVVISVGFIPYVWALKDSDASLAVPIFQTVPVFIFILEWVFMDRSFTMTGLVISLFIIAAAFGLSWDFRGRGFQLRVLSLMLLSSFILGCYSTIAKYYTDVHTPVYAYCWVLLGAGVAAIAVYSLYPPWFQQTRAILRGASTSLISVFAIQALFDIVAVGVFFLAISKAPAAAFVQTFNGLQPLYVLILSYGAGRLLSTQFDTHYLDVYFGWKLVCILALIGGVTALILHFRTGVM